MVEIDKVMTKLDYYPIRTETRRDPDEADLKRFEAEIGGKLPSQYRTFLARYGRTGLGHGALFSIPKPNPWGDTGSLDEFFGFTTDTSQDIVYQTMQTYAGRIPDETIPIGSDAGGNLFLLGFDEPVTNHVFFWDHEHLEIDAKRFEQMEAEVQAKGLDLSDLDSEALIRHWEQLYPEQLDKAAGYGNMYLIADSFMEFLKSLKPDPIYRKMAGK